MDITNYLLRKKETPMKEINKLVEIKKGQTGTGLLIENDGYLVITEEDRKTLKESIGENGGWNVPNPFIVSAVFQKYGIENANGRIYPEHVLRREVEKYQTKIQERRAYGECNHPSEITIDLGRIAMNIIELHWEGHTLVGKMEIETSEAFRRFGAITCLGDMVANHLINGLKIGVSSRGLGSVENKFGKTIVGDDYELVCWDVVSDPSTPGSWIAQESSELKQYVESNETKKDANKLIENLQRFDSWLNE